MKPKIQQLVRNAGLERIESALDFVATESIRIRAFAAEDKELSTGASKIGGMPDLPQNVQVSQELSFIAQLNLREVAQFDSEGILPETGMLYFFYDCKRQTWGFDPADRGAWKVVHLDGDIAGLKRTGQAEFKPCYLTFSSEVTLPPLESICIQRLKLSREEVDKYFKLLEELNEMYGSESTIHRLLGHPDPVQGDMQLECQLVSHGIYCGDASGYQDRRRSHLEDGVSDWRLLLQVDSEEQAGMMWGDLGRIYFWIQAQKLEQRKFDDVWLILQCG